MGIFHTMPHTGVFPTVPDERIAPDNLQHYHEGWFNYKSAEDELTEVKSLLTDMEENGWCTQYDRLSEIQAALKGKQPIFSSWA